MKNISLNVYHDRLLANCAQDKSDQIVSLDKTQYQCLSVIAHTCCLQRRKKSKLFDASIVMQLKCTISTSEIYHLISANNSIDNAVENGYRKAIFIWYGYVWLICESLITHPTETPSFCSPLLLLSRFTNDRLYIVRQSKTDPITS